MSMLTKTRGAPGDLFADEVNRMLRDYEDAEPEKLPREVYPIYALPLIGGDYSLTAEPVEHRSKAVKVFNGVTEVWLPRSQIRRIVAHQVIVSEWIVQRKRQFFHILKNQSPEYLAWLEKRQKEKDTATKWLADGGRRGISFSCQLDGTDY